MHPTLSQAFEDIISKPRLNSYRCYFNAQSTEEAIGLYMWNNELSACFSALLSFFEIALRNNVHRAMSQFYGKSNSYHWYDKISGSLKPDTNRKISEIRYYTKKGKQHMRMPAPGPDEIVSRVTFGFWPRVLSVIDKRYSDQIFPNIFPFHPLNINPHDWNVAAKKNSALEFIYELNDFRNRIAHHEPLWKFAAIKDTSNRTPIVIVPASNNIRDSLDRFTRLLNLFDDAIRAMNQDFHTDLLQSSWRKKLDYLLSNRGITRYKDLKHCPAHHHLTPTKFRRKFRLIVKENKPVRVGNSNMKGLFIPE
jgi:hypothetical protein